MKNYLSEMFLPGEVYRGTVTAIDCNKVCVDLHGGANGCIFSENINYGNRNLEIYQEYDFEILEVVSNDLISLTLPSYERYRLEIQQEPVTAEVVKVSHTAVALKIKGDIYLYKTFLGEVFFELLTPGDEVSVLMNSPFGDGKNMQVIDFVAIQIWGKKIKCFDPLYIEQLNPGEKINDDNVRVGELVELLYSSVEEAYFLKEYGTPAYVEKDFVINNNENIKHLGRVVRFDEDDIPYVELIHSWR